MVLSKDDETFRGAVVAGSLKEAIAAAQEEDEDVFIIGGANVYAQALPLGAAVVDGVVVGELV